MVTIRRAGLIVLLAAICGSLAAQQDRGRFAETVQVLEVEIPVEVVGRDGRPIRDITADRVRVFEGRRRLEIVDFQVFDRGRRERESIVDGRVASAARRHILLLFDLTYSDPLSISQARSAAKELVLEGLHESDLVAVATYSVEHGPTLLLTFTPDRAQVARAIDGLSFDRIGERATLDPLRFLVAPSARDVASGAAADRGTRGAEVRAELEAVLIESQQVVARRAARQEQEYSRSRALTWSRDMERLARTLAGVPGRKHVVLLSEGFHSQLLMGRVDLGSAAAQAEQQRTLSGNQWEVDNTTRFGDAGLRAQGYRLVEELQRADCVVQAVDIGGLRAGGDLQAVAHSPGEDTLFFFANETGGELFKDANDLNAQMAQALRRSELTYLVSVRPRLGKADGEFRRLRVEIDGLPRGARVVHRKGYYVPRPFPELDPLERDLLAADAIASAVPRDELGLNVLAAPFRSGGDRAYVPVILEVDGDSLFPDSEGERVELELYAYASNPEGEMVSFFDRSVGIEGRPEVLRKAGFKYYGHLELAAGSHLVRVLVRDLASGRVGLTTQRVDVPDFEDEPRVLLAPFFFDAPERWVLAKEAAAEGQSSVIYPFVVGGDPYIPQAAPRVRSGDTARFCLVGYNLPAGASVSGRLLRTDGGAAAAHDVTLERSPSGIAGLERWVGEVETAKLAPGTYRVEIVLDGPTGEDRWTSTSSLHVHG